MAPSAVEVEAPAVGTIPSKATITREPLKVSGALSTHEYFDVTPIIGREYPTANLVDFLEAPNSDELIRDLAITSKSTPTYLSNTPSYLTNQISL